MKPTTRVARASRDSLVGINKGLSYNIFRLRGQNKRAKSLIEKLRRQLALTRSKLSAYESLEELITIEKRGME